MPDTRQVRVSRDADGQFIMLPPGFQLPGTTAKIRKEGDCLIVEADVKQNSSDPTGLAGIVNCSCLMEDAAVGLRALMAGLSQEYGCAGWMGNLEYAIWRAQPDSRYGSGLITERESTLLRLLSDEAGGWWDRDDGHGSPALVSMNDGISRLNAREAQTP